MDSFERYRLALEANRKVVRKTNKHSIDRIGKSVKSGVLRNKTNSFFSLQNRLQNPHKDDKRDGRGRFNEEKGEAGGKNEVKESGDEMKEPSNENSGHKVLSNGANSIVVSTPLNTASKRTHSRTFAGVRNRFKKYTEEFQVNIYSNSTTWTVSVNPLVFCNWFINNKFDYILHDKNNELLRKVLNGNYNTKNVTGISKNVAVPKRGREQTILQTLKKNVYIRPEFTTNKALLKPTHIIDKSTKIGKFMYSVSLQNLSNHQPETAFLIATDTRFEPVTNSLLVLNQQNSYNKMGTKVYLRWHIYRDEVIDINLFK